MFGFWDWVGGRYSMDSAIGLSTMLAVGPERFREMLAGFHEMDEHFRTAPLERNLPVLMGLLAVWYRNFFGAQTVGVHALRAVPQALPRLPPAADDGDRTASTSRSPVRTSDSTPAPIYWGEPGTNGQHSFYQLIHQGTTADPGRPDRVRARRSNPLRDHHDLLIRERVRPGEALAFGKTEAEVRAEGTAEAVVPHRVMEGNRPTNVILAERLTPAPARARSSRSTSTACSPRERSGGSTPSTSGASSSARPSPADRAELESEAEPQLDHDSSTNALIRRYRRLKQQHSG